MAAPSPPGLTPAQVSAFTRDGFLIIPAALPPATVAALLAETHRLLDDFPLADHPMTRFSTGEENSSAAHVGDDYFLDSGDKIRFFFEEDAFTPAGTLAYPKARSINKIGHSLHTLSPPFASLLSDAASPSDPTSPTPSAITRSLGLSHPAVLQSMIICKQPSIGAAVPPHQDSSFLFTSPPSALGFWYALEDATRANGCLSFARGSHRWAPITRRFVRRAGGGTEFVANDGAQFPRGEEPTAEEAEAAAGRGEPHYELAEVAAGSLVLIHGNLLHKSEANTSAKGRIVYTFHVIEGDAEYDERNWLQPPEGGFTRI